MACLEERLPQYEHFVDICLTEAKSTENCNSDYETKLPFDYCQQVSTASNFEKGSRVDQKACRSFRSSDYEKDCRICLDNLQTFSHELGIPVALGCSCKGCLAVAHQKCAEKWFKIKGDKNCEICGSTAMNLVGFGDTDSIKISISSDNNAAAAATETHRFCHGYRLINCIFGGLLLVIVLCWQYG